MQQRLLQSRPRLQEGRQQPHQVVGDGAQEAALPVYQERLHALTPEVLQFLVLHVAKVNVNLAEHEVVGFCVSVAQSIEVPDPRIIQNLNQ